MVREFKLVNEKGQEYSLMELYNFCFLSDPTGLGYSYSTEYQQIGNTFLTNLRKMEQGQISGTVNFNSYDNYRKLIDFIENSEKLRFAYKIPYVTGFKEYFKDVQIQSISKTQKQIDRILKETIVFDCLSLWYEENTIEYAIEPMEDEMRWDFYWGSYFNDSNSTNIEYTNKGQVEAPIQVEIDGAAVNPKIQLFIEGVLYQTVSINTSILEYEKLIYDSRENQFEISRIKTDGSKEKLFKWGIIDFENENIVVRIPKNKSCEIRLSADNTITNAKLVILPQYKCV